MTVDGEDGVVVVWKWYGEWVFGDWRQRECGEEETDRQREAATEPARTSTAHTQLANRPQPSLFPASERRPARGAPAKFQGGAVLLPTSSSFIPA